MLKINMVLGNIPKEIPGPRTIDYIIEYFILGIIALPLIIMLIYTIVDPETMATWRYSFTYKEKPEPSEEYLQYLRAVGVVGLLILLSLVILSISNFYGIIFFLVSISAALYYFLIR